MKGNSITQYSFGWVRLFCYDFWDFLKDFRSVWGKKKYMFNLFIFFKLVENFFFLVSKVLVLKISFILSSKFSFTHLFLFALILLWKYLKYNFPRFFLSCRVPSVMIFSEQNLVNFLVIYSWLSIVNFTRNENEWENFS